MSIFSRIKSALSKTASSITKVGEIFTKKGVSTSTLDELEEILLTVDFGVVTTSKIINELKTKKISKEDSEDKFKEILSDIILEILSGSSKKIDILDNELNVILFCGVNGNGKTTTIGKLSNLFRKLGKNVVIAGCDTFRSAANDQLKVWADRTDAQIILGEPNSDPASVAFKALEYAQKNNADILLIDTAGRLQNQNNLMEELNKIVKILKKANPKFPNYSVLTLDATTGQNAFGQVEKFKAIADISGIIFTKMDGTAKGGAIVGIVDKFNLPIYYITLGEKIEDIVEFDPKSFSAGLVSQKTIVF